MQDLRVPGARRVRAAGQPQPRRRPQPQLRRLLGRRRREPRPDQRHLPRRRPVLRAGVPERARARLEPPGDDADHQPHVLRPRAAPAGPRSPRATPPDEPIYKDLGDTMAAENGYTEPEELGALRHDRHDRGLELLRHRRPRLHVRDRQQPTARRLETLAGVGFHPAVPDRRRSPSTTASTRRAAATARPTSRRSSATADTSRHSVLAGTAPAGTRLTARSRSRRATSPVIQADGSTADPILFDDTPATRR